MDIVLVAYQIATSINAKENEKKKGETPERRTTIAEKWQRNAYHRGQAQHHAYIDEDMEEEYR